MKTAFKFMIAATAAIAVFSSCQKELVNESATNATDGVRVISVQFDNSTKASLSGFTPTFTNNDKIRVSNTEKSEECSVTVEGATTTFTTTLSGALTAIYPADAAVLSSNTDDAPIATSNNFKVLATQDGTVEKAIIASATVAEGENTATFNGLTALFEITPPSNAKKITVTSLKKVESGSRTGTAADINTEDMGKTVITVGDGSADLPDTIYVALVPGVNLTDLSFDAGEAVGMKGIPTNKLGSHSDQTTANTKYAIGNTNWHPYVEIGGKKWATENIGATASNPYGTYFEWGNTTGHALKVSSIGATGNISWAFVSNYKFSWANCPYQTASTTDSSSTKFTKYLGNTSSKYKDASATNADAMKTVLDLTDDAAYANWGGPWRMPTGGTESNADFTALAKAANEGYTSSSFSYTSTIIDGGAPSSRGVYYYKVTGKTVGVYFVDSSSKKLFFPVTGGGNGTTLWDAGSDGLYWSSSLKTETEPPYFAYDLRFTSTLVNPQNRWLRYLGYPVRPVSD